MPLTVIAFPISCPVDTILGERIVFRLKVLCKIIPKISNVNCVELKYFKYTNAAKFLLNAFNDTFVFYTAHIYIYIYIYIYYIYIYIYIIHVPT